MADYRTYYDKEFIGWWDLHIDTVVTIKDVRPGKVKGDDGNESSKAIVTLSEFEKPWVCNITNAKCVANMYGNDTTKWRGKKITLFPTQVQAFGDSRDCIRVRPSKPGAIGPAKKTKAETGMALRTADQPSPQIYYHASEWLDALEQALNDADPQVAVELWDANQSVLYEIVKSMERVDNQVGVKRANEVGLLALERIGVGPTTEQ